MNLCYMNKVVTMLDEVICVYICVNVDYDTMIPQQ